MWIAHSAYHGSPDRGRLLYPGLFHHLECSAKWPLPRLTALWSKLCRAEAPLQLSPQVAPSPISIRSTSHSSQAIVLSGWCDYFWWFPGWTPSAAPTKIGSLANWGVSRPENWQVAGREALHSRNCHLRPHYPPLPTMACSLKGRALSIYLPVARLRPVPAISGSRFGLSSKSPQRIAFPAWVHLRRSAEWRKRK